MTLLLIVLIVFAIAVGVVVCVQIFDHIKSSVFGHYNMAPIIIWSWILLFVILGFLFLIASSVDKIAMINFDYNLIPFI